MTYTSARFTNEGRTSIIVTTSDGRELCGKRKGVTICYGLRPCPLSRRTGTIKRSSPKVWLSMIPFRGRSFQN